MRTRPSLIKHLAVGAFVGLAIGGIGIATHPITTIARPALAHCYTDGAKLCAPTDMTSKDGWRVWQESDGPSKLKVDPSRAFRVDFLGTAIDYPEKLDGYDLALVGKDGKWYVFRATPTS